VPRRLKILTREAGPLELQLIYQVGDMWEAAWAPLQNTEFASLFSTVTDEVMNHAIRGYTKPFVTALGLQPQGALRKLPKEHQRCEHVERCPYYDAANCSPSSKKMPDCFQPKNVVEEARTLAYEAIRLWRDAVYIVVVQEPLDAHRNYPRARR
jgi:hypothetical protein